MNGVQALVQLTLGWMDNAVQALVRRVLQRQFPRRMLRPPRVDIDSPRGTKDSSRSTSSININIIALAVYYHVSNVPEILFQRYHHGVLNLQFSTMLEAVILVSSWRSFSAERSMLYCWKGTVIVYCEQKDRPIQCPQH